ncbi:MAG: bifunctional nuclease family protein [Acidimicrobiales bacterium]
MPVSGNSTASEQAVTDTVARTAADVAGEELVMDTGAGASGGEPGEKITADVAGEEPVMDTGAGASGGEPGEKITADETSAEKITADETSAEAAGATPGSAHPYSPWSVVLVDDVRMELPSSNPVVVLREQDAPWRELHIPVGLAEGNYIAYGTKKIATPRPLVHDLMLDLLERHQVSVEAARIVGVKGKLFLAELETMGPKGRQVIQCRPSDAIALAVRTKMPIPVLVAEWVFVSVYHVGKPAPSE